MSTQMLARVGGDRALLAEVIGFFLEDCPPLIETMRRALAEGNYPAVSTAAHALLGSAGNFDAIAVTALARRLEELAAAQNVAASREVFAELDSETILLMVNLTATRATLRCAS